MPFGRFLVGLSPIVWAEPVGDFTGAVGIRIPVPDGNPVVVAPSHTPPGGYLEWPQHPRMLICSTAPLLIGKKNRSSS